MAVSYGVAVLVSDEAARRNKDVISLVPVDNTV